jgi:hypothetical protein
MAAIDAYARRQLESWLVSLMSSLVCSWPESFCSISQHNSENRDIHIINKMMKVELSLHASKLKNVGGLGGKSDPYAVVTHISTQPGQKPQVIGKTET